MVLTNNIGEENNIIIFQQNELKLIFFNIIFQSYLRCLPQKDIVEQSRCPPRWHMRAPRTTAVDSTENEIEIVVGTSMPLSVVVNNDKLTLDDVSFNVVDDANRKVCLVLILISRIFLKNFLFIVSD